MCSRTTSVNSNTVPVPSAEPLSPPWGSPGDWKERYAVAHEEASPEQFREFETFCDRFSVLMSAFGLEEGRWTTSKQLLQALVYNDAGLCCIPIQRGRKQANGAWKCYQTDRPRVEELHEWFASGQHDIGLVCGQSSGNLYALDFESQPAYQDWAGKVEAEFPHLLDQLAIATTPRGIHVLFRTMGPRPSEKLAYVPAPEKDGEQEDWQVMIESRGHGGYIVAPGSADERRGWLHQVTVLPPPRLEDTVTDRLLDLARAFDQKGKHRADQTASSEVAPTTHAPARSNNGQATPLERARKYLDACEPAIEGEGGDDRTFKILCKLIHGFGLTHRQVWEAIRPWNARCQPPWEMEELNRKINEAREHGSCPDLLGEQPRHVEQSPARAVVVAEAQESPSEVLETDVGNMTRFVQRHGQELRYCGPWNKWLCWTGSHWAPDTAGTPMYLAMETARQLLRSAADLSGAAQQAAVKHAMASLNVYRLEAMVRLASVYPSLQVTPNQLDSDPLLLSLPNGTLDLRKRVIRNHQRTDLITRICPTRYDDRAECPTWTKFLSEVFCANQDLIGFMQKLMGYCLSGLTTEHILPILVGTGANGKSVFIGAMQHVLGPDFYCTAAPELLMCHRGDRHPTEMADLFGKRLVVCSETPESGRLNETLCKLLTGGDRLKARRMREDFWEFTPSHKLFLVTNHLPEVPGGGHGTWRRLRVIQFSRTFTEKEQDKQLPDKLQAEASGILNWCIYGYRAWQQGGLNPPQCVLLATRDYQVEEDVVGQFIDTCCAKGTEERISATALYTNFKLWRKKCGVKDVDMPTQRAFGNGMNAHGFERGKSNGVKVYKGITMRQGWEGGP
jgi:P4 family phage/plasmid primase-like protien